MEVSTPQFIDPKEMLARDMFDVAGLESIARSGIETYKGRRELEFRVGVEMEFCVLQDPSKVRKTLEDDTFFSRPETKSAFIRDLMNPADLDAETQDHSELFSDFQSYAKGFINRMSPKDDAEAETKKKWVSEIDGFKPRDMLHFLLYEEFSNPSLSIPLVPEEASLAEVDDFSEKAGWIEWRFGTGNLQSGYYDNEGISEIRLSPCSPTEAVKRSRLIRERIAQLGNTFGFVVKDGGTGSIGLIGEHLNMSVYDTSSPDSASLVGNDEKVAEDTVDITSGIMAGFQDRMWVNPYNLANYDYVFSEHSLQSIEVAPTRKNLRVLGNRLELRSSFHSTEHGLAWMMAGAIDGLQNGAEKLAEQGYAVSKVSDVHRTIRSDSFKKDDDLQVQRAFEGSTMDENGRFELGVGYEMTRGNRLSDELFQGTDAERVDVSLLIAAVSLSSDGQPFVSAQQILDRYEELPDYRKTSMKLPSDTELAKTVEIVNQRLATVRIYKDKAVVGRAEVAGVGKQETFDRLRQSRVARLALGSSMDAHIQNLAVSVDEFTRKNVASN